MKTVDISGMGGSYEDGCQKMLQNGIRFLEKHPDFSFKRYRSYEGVYGIIDDEEVMGAKDLDKALTEGVEGTTGAQHQAVISHLAYIHIHSYEEWLSELKKAGRELIEAKTEKELDKDLHLAQTLWEAELASGNNPLQKILDKIPADQVIHVNPDDPADVEKAAEKIKKLIKGD